MNTKKLRDPFPIQNLPFGVFKPRDGTPRCGVAIGDSVLDLAVLAEADLLPAFGETGLFGDSTLNRLGSLGPNSLADVTLSSKPVARCGLADDT
jgi:fumarylacetoacetase